MKHRVQLTVLAWKEGEVFVADCPPLRIASQGDTEKFALENLKDAVELYFEDMPGTELPTFADAHHRAVEVAFASYADACTGNRAAFGTTRLQPSVPARKPLITTPRTGRCDPHCVRAHA
jgi:predicted RNase H-like HicB family nuclease